MCANKMGQEERRSGMSCCVLGQSPMERGSQQETGVWHPGGVSKKTSDIICSSSRLPGKESGTCVGLGDGETDCSSNYCTRVCKPVFSPGSWPGAQGGARNAQ